MAEHHFKIRVDGELHDVAVSLADSGLARVEVEGRDYEVVATGDGSVIVRERERSRQIPVVLDRDHLPTQASVAGNRHELEVKTAQAAAADAVLAAASGGDTGGTMVSAPMPGRVVRILVAEGQAVDVEAPVIIVEAMKMENELSSTIAGTVQAILVSEGDTVDAGQGLCEIAAHDSD